MNKEINQIFNNNIRLLSNMDKLVYFFRIQNYDKALRIATDIIDILSSNIELLISHADYFNEEIVRMNSDTLLGMMNCVLDAQDNRDYILLADLYEIQLIPFFTNLQEYIIAQEKFDYPEQNYSDSITILKESDYALAELLNSQPLLNLSIHQGPEIEFASCGLMTLSAYDKGKKYYLHSNRNVSSEAFLLASSWYKEDKSNYIIYGLGLGYHIYELMALDDGIQIEVYESDIKIIQLVCSYIGLKNIISNSKFKLIYDPDLSKVMKRIGTLDDATDFVIHYPSLRNLTNDTIRERLEEYYIQYSSIKNQSPVLNSNFQSNILQDDNSVDELEDSFKNKDLYIVASGPSLDQNFLLLKELKNKGIIMATGTVFRKLLNAGITPNYVIVTDANPRVYKQILGLEESSIPMLYLSTANKQFAKNYKGKKYIICQEGYPKAENYAKEKGFKLYQTGGSVSTTALDIGINFGCKRIIFLGLDLAYTNNYVHALDTSRRELQRTDYLLQVEDVNGNKIFTTKVLNIYRKWIEDRINNITGIEFIDATEGGAKIEGMKIRKLSECISPNEDMKTGQNPISH